MPRFGFVTCVRLGLECMEAIYAAGSRLDLVITLPDDRARKKSGRVYVDAFCRERSVPLVKTPNVNDEAAVRAVREAGIDWLFIIGWSQIARAEMLGAPGEGVLGMHPTLLPEGRGRASIPWAILKDVRETGVTLFKLDEGVDTGPILAQERIPLDPGETATTLYARVVAAHRALMLRVLPELEAGTVVPRVQDDARSSYWEGRKPEDGRIEPSMTVAQVERLVRAVTRPYPGAFVEENGAVVRIWAGRPAAGATPPPGARRFTFADGAYDAVDFDLEAS
jgi:methionyl-tRNA formyltransferase